LVLTLILENILELKKTVSDNIKYGDTDIPDDLIGMTDQSAKLADRVTIIEKNKD